MNRSYLGLETIRTFAYRGKGGGGSQQLKAAVKRIHGRTRLGGLILKRRQGGRSKGREGFKDSSGCGHAEI